MRMVWRMKLRKFRPRQAKFLANGSLQRADSSLVEFLNVRLGQILHDNRQGEKDTKHRHLGWIVPELGRYQKLITSFLLVEKRKANPQNQAGKRNPNPNFLVRISSGGVRVFHVKGWGPKSSVCPSKPRETNLFGGISRGFGRDIPGCPKSLRKRKFVFNFGSLQKIVVFTCFFQQTARGASGKGPRQKPTKSTM